MNSLSPLYQANERIDGPTHRGASATPARASGRRIDLRGEMARRTAVAGGGRVTFEWHASRAHLLQHGTAELPEAPDNVSIIGCDAANGTYFQLYSDERGVCRVYEMSIGNGEWKLWRQGEPFSQRFTATATSLRGRAVLGRPRGRLFEAHRGSRSGRSRGFPGPSWPCSITSLSLHLETQIRSSRLGDATGRPVRVSPKEPLYPSRVLALPSRSNSTWTPIRRRFGASRRRSCARLLGCFGHPRPCGFGRAEAGGRGRWGPPRRRSPGLRLQRLPEPRQHDPTARRARHRDHARSAFPAPVRRGAHRDLRDVGVLPGSRVAGDPSDLGDHLPRYRPPGLLAPAGSPPLRARRWGRLGWWWRWRKREV